MNEIKMIVWMIEWMVEWFIYTHTQSRDKQILKSKSKQTYRYTKKCGYVFDYFAYAITFSVNHLCFKKKNFYFAFFIVCFLYSHLHHHHWYNGENDFYLDQCKFLYSTFNSILFNDCCGLKIFHFYTLF